jgi:hypothetical protein
MTSARRSRPQTEHAAAPEPEEAAVAAAAVAVAALLLVEAGAAQVRAPALFCGSRQVRSPN